MQDPLDTRNASRGRRFRILAPAAVTAALAIGAGTAHAGSARAQADGDSLQSQGAPSAAAMLLGIVTVGTGALLRVAAAGPATPAQEKPVLPAARRRPVARLRTRTAGPVALSPREREILELIAGGEGNRAIAKRLFLSEDTVKTHVRRILDKLEARTRAEAVAVAIRSGWLV